MLGFDLDVFSKKFPVKKRDFSLDHLSRLLTKLGSPHLKLPPAIHVAGTNGKGSTIAFLRAIFEAAGHKVHTYTSPHLIKMNERIVIAGQEIETSYFMSLLQDCEKYSENLENLTWFQIITSSAFLAYAQNPADILLLETGVGGRFDATNVIETPIATAITSISYDHMNYLGNNLSEIAFAKAGIFKTGAPAFSVLQTREAKETLSRCAADLSIPLYIEGQDWTIDPENDGLTFNSRIECPTISLKGKHQLQNAGLALSIASFLQKSYHLEDAHLKNGVQSAKWKGRLQNLASTFLAQYLEQPSEIWLDSAHNEGGAKALIENLETWDHRPTYFVIGMLNHKDPRDFLSLLAQKSEGFCFIPIASSNKHFLPKELRDFIPQENAMTALTLSEALQKISSQSSGSVRVIICGSVYLAGDVLKILENPDE